MSKLIVGVQCESLGQRCGIFTYASRVNKYLNELEDVESKMFVKKYKNGKPSVINIHYEPGMMPPNKLMKLLDKYTDPVVVTAHHTN